jgi:hypothetical protein
MATEPKYGNRILFCQTDAVNDRDIIATTRGDVKQRESHRHLRKSAVKLTEKHRELFLATYSTCRPLQTHLRS